MPKAILDLVLFARWPDEEVGRAIDDIKSKSRLPRTIFLIDCSGTEDKVRTVPAAWNLAASLGGAEYIAFLPTDVKLCPAWDRKLRECLESHREIGVALSAVFADERPLVLVPGTAPMPLGSGEPTDADMANLSEWALAYQGILNVYDGCDGTFYVAMMRRETWSVVRGFDERFRIYGADHDFQRRMRRLTGKLAASVRSCPVYRHGGRTSVESIARDCADLPAEFKHLEEVRASLSSQKIKEWDLLDEEERRRVRTEPLYATIPYRARE